MLTSDPDEDAAPRWEAYLREFHSNTPRASTLAHELFADARGNSSYARLVAILERMPDPRKLAVLDLGCGDGHLIDHIRLLTGDGARVDGIDLVPEEIARAKAWGRQAELVVGRAQELPYDDASFHAVLSHFAFSVMVPPEPVVAEIERVLRPGGFFATALMSYASARDDLAAILAAFCDERRRAAPLGDAADPERRNVTPEAIAALFAAAGSTRVMRQEAVPFVATVDADAAWLYLTTLYFFDVLDTPARKRLRAHIDARAAANGGRLNFRTTIEFVAMVPPPTKRNLPR